MGDNEPDLKGLPREFVLKVMKRCAEDHDGMHCDDVGRHGDKHCPNAIKCTPENCREPEWIEGGTPLMESFVFVHEFTGTWHHKISTEMVSIIEVKDGGSGDDKDFGCTHTVEMCYTNGTEHKWHATYGVNPEEEVISLWAD